ncbi:MAG: TlpA disulfide reductase family protein [Gemmatimonadetes bacterium]|nr:TlpA disulfide reductase family protein [Gemmatimonadota bacterium]
MKGSTGARVGARTRSALALSIAVTAAFVAACSADAPKGTIAVGSVAPDYATLALEGDSVSLAGLRGQVVLLNVWATWCHPCRDEIPQLEALHQRYAKDGLVVAGVSVDVPGMEAGIREFMRDFSMTYPVWLDPDERVSAQFRLIGVPETFLIDRQGVIRWRKIGPIQPTDSTLSAALESALAG